MDLCAYRDMFGIPGKGVHSYRVWNLAIVDVVMTVLVAYVLSYALNTHVGYTMLGLFLLGILFHRLFCVRTTIDKFLFPS